MQGRKRKSERLLSGVLVLVLSASLLLALPVMASDYAVDYAYRLDKAAEYLLLTQNEDGGMPAAFNEDSATSPSSFALMALCSYDSTMNRAENKYLREYLDGELASDLNQEATLDLARYLIAVGPEGARRDAAVAELESRLRYGHYGISGEEKMLNTQTWSMMALKAQGRAVPDKAVSWLLDRQNTDGGYGWITGGSSDPDSTGVVLAALGFCGLREVDVKVQYARNYLKKQMGENGGMDLDKVGENTASDAWAAMGLLAVGVDVRLRTDFRVENRDMLDHLIGLQDGRGWFNWREEDDASKVMMTSYGMMALSGRPFGMNLNRRVTKDTTLYVNGDRVAADVAPLLIDGRMMVPVSFVATSLGAGVTWESKTKTVRMSYQGKDLELVIGQEIPGLGTPIIRSERTMVPVRYVAESFGKQVYYTRGTYETKVTVY